MRMRMGVSVRVKAGDGLGSRKEIERDQKAEKKDGVEKRKRDGRIINGEMNK